MLPYYKPPEEPPPDPEPPEDPDPGNVTAWRHERLEAAGWPEPCASILAAIDDVDLHEACRLLEDGCDVVTAWEIVCPW